MAALFGKPKSSIVKIAKKKIPDGLWTKCEDCGHIIYNKALDEALKVCPQCDYHFVLNAPERLQQLLDAGTFEEWDAGLSPMDPLEFHGPTSSYRDKLEEEQRLSGLTDACVTGRGAVAGQAVALGGARPPVVAGAPGGGAGGWEGAWVGGGGGGAGQAVAIGVTDSRFMMGSMGSVLGEKITRLIERAIDRRLPVVIVSGSGGGARMHEGMYSLMQMAKTSAALARLHEHKGFYIAVLTNPTMAGVLASFATLGDVILAEPRALIGFTGPRVIQQTLP